MTFRLRAMVAPKSQEHGERRNAVVMGEVRANRTARMDRRMAPAADAASAGLCAAAGAVAAAIAVEGRVSLVAQGIAGCLVKPQSLAPWLAPYVGFLALVAAGVAGALMALAVLRLGDRVGRRGWVPPLLLGLVATLGGMRGRWLLWAAPLACVVLMPLLVAGRVREAPRRSQALHFALVCLVSESACLGVGAWLPHSASLPTLLLPAMFAPAMLALYAATRSTDDLRWRAACAGLPLLVLPLFGLFRNPTILPTLAFLSLGMIIFGVLGRWPAAATRLTGWSRRHAIVVALAALALVFIVPWRFRDLESVDHFGHEGQHYGWINSIMFGKLMMADAGFTYGPGREYALAAIAWLLGGATCEHIRLAHVVVNALGLVFLVAAMRRVCGGQLHILVIGVLLLLTHSSLVCLLLYTTTYSFGWADASRAGLAALAVVMALARDRRDRRASRNRLNAAGVVAALALLYSHDFGLPAVVATWLGLASEAFVAGLAADVGAGAGGRQGRARILGALRAIGAHVVGLAIVVGPFLAFYAARGRLGALFAGYRWTVLVSSGASPFGAPWKITPETFASYRELVSSTDPGATLSPHTLDYVVGPVIVAIGVVHVAVAAARRHFVQRTVVVFGLSALAAMTLRHAFLTVDPWHMANGSTPGLVLLVALMAGGRRLVVRTSSAVGAHVLPVGAALAALIPSLWLANGSAALVNARLARIAAGEERPSFGERYRYDDLPRAGDIAITGQHLDPVRYVREHSKPSDSVFCTTWLLGGGAEAFLSDRRNPTTFDKPDEILGQQSRRRVLADLTRDPPALVVGNFFDYLGDDGRRFIERGWHVTSTAGTEIRTRNP